MSDVDIDDIIEVTLDGRYGSNVVQNVYQYSLIGGGGLTAGDALDDILEVFEAMAVLLKALLAIGYTFNRIRALNKTQQSDLGYASFAATPAGTSGGDAYALQAAYGVTLNTAKFKTRGRKFIGPFTESKVGAAGLISGTELAALMTYIDFLVDPFVAANGNWQCGVVAYTDGSFNPVTGGIVTIYPVTQRRRRPGVGV